MRKDSTGSPADLASPTNDLPDRFPVGTRYVIEGRGGGNGLLRVHSRYLEFPDGRHVDLPIDLAKRTGVRSRQDTRRRVRRRGGRATGRK